MWWLIIAVTSYIAIFSFGAASNQAYAANIAVSRDTTEEEISFEETIIVNSDETSSSSSSSATPQDDQHDAPVTFNSVSPHAPIYSSSMSAHPETTTVETHTQWAATNIDIYMAELFMLEDAFPTHEAFQANNKKVLTFIAEKFAGKSVDKQMYFLGKLIDVFGTLTRDQQASYGIDADILVPLFQFMIIKGESAPMHGKNTMPWLFSKFDLTYPIKWMTTFKMKDAQQVTRLNIYVNKRFIRSCERNQCDYFSLDAVDWDLIEFYYSDGNHGTIIDQYTL